uniref:hypothetical protein n=1 Tax=uncultured Psychrobacter sp. TaxID=259303 RepID=UPI002593CAB7|nr:hypothetical protein [uncultured Psychrobacter sp.]
MPLSIGYLIKTARAALSVAKRPHYDCSVTVVQGFAVVYTQYIPRYNDGLSCCSEAIRPMAAESPAIIQTIK